MRCCEAWKPIENCFDPNSFECVDFQRLSQIIANLSRQNLAERESETTNLSWTQTEKDNALARCRIGQRACAQKKPVLCLSAVTDEGGHPLENEDESGRRLRENWRSIFDSRVEGPRHHQYEDISRCVWKAPDDIHWTIDRTEFNELLPGRKIPHLTPIELNMALTDVRGDWAPSSFLTLASICGKEVPFHNISLKAGRSLSPRPLTSMTLEELRFAD